MQFAAVCNALPCLAAAWHVMQLLLIFIRSHACAAGTDARPRDSSHADTQIHRQTNKRFFECNSSLLRCPPARSPRFSLRQAAPQTSTSATSTPRFPPTRPRCWPPWMPRYRTSSSMRPPQSSWATGCCRYDRFKSLSEQLLPGAAFSALYTIVCVVIYTSHLHWTFFRNWHASSSQSLIRHHSF